MRANAEQIGGTIDDYYAAYPHYKETLEMIRQQGDRVTLEKYTDALMRHYQAWSTVNTTWLIKEAQP